MRPFVPLLETIAICGSRTRVSAALERRAHIRIQPGYYSTITMECHVTVRTCFVVCAEGHKKANSSLTNVLPLQKCSQSRRIDHRGTHTFYSEAPTLLHLVVDAWKYLDQRVTALARLLALRVGRSGELTHTVGRNPATTPRCKVSSSLAALL